MSRKFIIFLFGVILAAGILIAQDKLRDRQVEKSVKIHFRQGKYIIDENYMGNKEVLESFAQEVNAYYQDTTVQFRQIRITASASPEGSRQINERLVKLRAEAITNWISRKINVKLDYAIDFTGIDWEYLVYLIEEEDNVPYGNEVISLIKETPEFVETNGKKVNERYNKFRRLRGGEPYRWIYNHLFPKMRYATAHAEFWCEIKSEPKVVLPPVVESVVEPVFNIITESPIHYTAAGGTGIIEFSKSVVDDSIPTVYCDAQWIESIRATKDEISYIVLPNPDYESRTDTITVTCYGQSREVVITQEKARKPFYMSLKTNMLYDLVAVPNIGAEFYLGKNFSIAGNWHYSWWRDTDVDWFWRTYGGDLSIRYWLGEKAKEKPLTGHHLGVYGQMITYDFETGGRGYLADRWSWTAGVEYGYSMPMTRRLNLDFTIGVGYHWGEFKEYLPIDGHYVWQATKNRNYFGPTKAEVSLVWLIGYGNYNKGKR